MDNIFFMIHITSMAGAGYLGYKVGYILKNVVNIEPIKTYKDRLGFEDSYIMTEDRFCNAVTGLCGVLVGRLFWPVTLPLTVLYTEKVYGDVIRQIIKEASNKNADKDKESK